MAELNLDQIIEKLNREFEGDTRKLVFWYDDNGDFADDIDSVKLENAKVYRLTPTNQFRTKILLERQDKTTNYLLYAPFPKPPVEQNHLEDTLLYSRRFYVDRASLISVDLGIQEKYKPVIQKYIRFFGEKKRTQRFYDLEIENFTEETIEIALMSALCQSKTASFEEVVRILLTDGGLENNRFLADFEKFGLLDAFWKQCESSFGYVDNRPSLEKLVMTLFVTYTAKYVKAELPQTWKSFISYKPGNVMVFLDSLMNNLLYRDCYDRLSAHVEAKLSVDRTFAAISPDSFVECDTFLCVDQLLISWINERLVNEDTGAQLSVLPSYTALGMAALLPHKTLEMTDDYKILIDGKGTNSIQAREAILQSYQPSCGCIQFDDLKHMKRASDLRSVFTGKQVSFPVSTSVFKAGGGMNYVHGGSSPQEMIVPILDIKMERYHMETRTVQIALLSIVRKITNLVTSLDFIQTEPVSDTVKDTSFRIYFISEDNERVTNENIMTADSRSEEPAKRIVRLRFTFKNQKYDLSKHYYLVAYDEKNNLEAFRQEIVIDIAFTDVFL